MAEKGFGVKEINLIGASGTPTIESPNNLNLNAVNVAISTNATIGGNLTVTGNVGVAGTLTYEDVTNVDAIGIVTAREGVFLPDDKKLELGNAAGSGDIAIYHNGSDAYIDNDTGGLRINTASDEVQINKATNEYMARFITDGAVQLYHNNNEKLATTSTGISITGTLAATAVTGDGSGLTGIAVTEAPVTDYTISANGSSAYRFHGGGVDETANNPDLYLIRGQKYRFNNTTGSGHPFAIRVSNGGSAYTDGVSGSNQGIQFFTVPYAAPASLVYQCTIHSGMVGNIYIRGGSSTANISNNADNRVITGGSGGNLNGEASLIYTGSRMGINASGGSITDIPATAHDTIVVGNSTMTSGGIVLQGAADTSGNLGYQFYKGGSFPCARVLYEGSSNELQFHSTSTAAGSTPAAESRKVRILPGGNVVFDNGDLVLASGHGIDYSAQTAASSGSVVSEVMNHFSTGTIGITLKAGSNTVPLYNNTARYTRIGNICFISIWIRVNGSTVGSSYSSSDTLKLTNLPFAGAGNSSGRTRMRFNGYAFTGVSNKTWGWMTVVDGATTSEHELHWGEPSFSTIIAPNGTNIHNVSAEIYINGHYFC